MEPIPVYKSHCSDGMAAMSFREIMAYPQWTLDDVHIVSDNGDSRHDEATVEQSTTPGTVFTDGENRRAWKRLADWSAQCHENGSVKHAFIHTSGNRWLRSGRTIKTDWFSHCRPCRGGRRVLGVTLGAMYTSILVTLSSCPTRETLGGAATVSKEILASPVPCLIGSLPCLLSM